jgi:hypothetical protein
MEAPIFSKGTSSGPRLNEVESTVCDTPSMMNDSTRITRSKQPTM